MSENNDDKIVRFSTCKTCDGFVRTMALEIIDSKSLSSFEKEVKKFDLEVKDVKLKEWRELDLEFCSCN